jgi:CMP/dCMP kinase
MFESAGSVQLAPPPPPSSSAGDPATQSPVSATADRRFVENTVFRLDRPIIITIDGPAGTGKSSVARILAKKLGLDFLDTGAMYRAAAVIAIEKNLVIPSNKGGSDGSISDRTAFLEAVRDADIRFNWKTDPPDLLAWGRSVTRRLRDKDVTSIVSPIAGIGELRHHMVDKQRQFAREHPRLVSEGRDQGSVVFPDATVKFYLDADARVRAARRMQQLLEAGQSADEGALLEDILARDRSDMGRTDGPLVKPADAIVLDTSHLSFAQVVDELSATVMRLARTP